MSADVYMSSDDDKPLGVKHSTNGHSNSNGNGHVSYSNGKQSRNDDQDSSMSEDDVPLLSQSSRYKSEPATPTPRRPQKRRAAYSSSSDDDTPLASSPSKQTKSAAIPMPGAINGAVVRGNGSSKRASTSIKREEYEAKSSASDDEDEDSPVKKRPPPKKSNGKNGAPPKKKVRVKDEDDDSAFPSDSEDESKKKRRKRAPKAKAKVRQEQSDDDSDDDKPLVKPRTSEKPKEVDDSRKGKAKKEKDSKSQTKKRKEEEEEEEKYKWWEMEDPNGDGSIKWTTLIHNGVYFPPPYEPLPSNVKMKYAGKPVDLPPESEEVAGFYGAMIETEHAKDAVFNKNFFTDFKKVLDKHSPRNGIKIEKFEYCDFRPLFEYFEAEKAKKKAMTTTEKKAAKAAKDKLEEKYTTCLLDGRKEKVGNFRIEPPGLFRGRGEHPKKGSLKLRVRPEDITINIGEGVKIPEPNMPGKWKKVIHDQTVTWLANWTENVNGQHKYVFLAAGSSLKGQSDMMKFEKARNLKEHVDRIRKDYQNDLRSRLMADRQRATTMYFIDRLALRAGNEKGEDEADTVGCCSLRCEHVTLEQPNFVVFDFLGKDSIRYYNRVEVEPQIVKNIRIFKDNKEDSDALFDRVNTTLLNKHLQSYMSGLTAKVFRTYNASITFQEQLDVYTPKEGSVQEKLNAYNKANRMVAILCNHQKSVSKNHSTSMEKMNDKLRAFKYERMKLRHALFNMDPKSKKNKKYAQDESDIDDDWIASFEDSQREKEIEKANKKFAKDNEKLVADGEVPQKESVLQERIERIEAEHKQLISERGTKKTTKGKGKTPEKIEELIDKLDERIKTHKLQMIDREEGKEVALGTSKINYLDPRITAAWCKTHNVPIEKLFSKALLTKFPWAMEVEEDWKF